MILTFESSDEPFVESMILSGHYGPGSRHRLPPNV
jgi:hypothetical protein